MPKQSKKAKKLHHFPIQDESAHSAIDIINILRRDRANTRNTNLSSSIISNSLVSPF
ncbi:hypothetical protein [Oscillatoria salina]|uniref:hypothetical protein n=1 Tax=Oscillatoria salina TaxID=331517 RepID=UPI0013BE1362|nr:hypothetical protein [Oscillatoria salina]MBZ8182566.1 hypothetical protein [Oscillatoria salina IIICB1]NET88285.1 hypothetical protein [Kamptonema sp. SIO1D9]